MEGPSSGDWHTESRCVMTMFQNMNLLAWGKDLSSMAAIYPDQAQPS